MKDPLELAGQDKGKLISLLTHDAEPETREAHRMNDENPFLRTEIGLFF
jgi:hypothetical protein